MENSTVDEKGMWMCGAGGPECVSVDLFELRHGGALVQQVEETAVMVGRLDVIIVVAGGGHRRKRSGCKNHNCFLF